MKSGRPCDADLARRCRQGHPAAWRELAQTFTPLAYRLALRMLGRQEEAEDACQEVFLRVHRSFGSFDPTRPIAPWISRITYNVCLRRLEKSRRYLAQSTDPERIDGLVENGQKNPQTQIEDIEAGDLLERALSDLSAQDRFLLVLRYREGLADAEVSEATGIPVGTVKTRIFRARKTLRKLLAPVFKDD